MLTGVHRLGLEVKDLDAARAFYEDRLGFDPEGRPATESERVAYSVGSHEGGGSAATGTDPARLVLRRPTDTPRGGVHTHYAFSTTPRAYERWWRRLADLDPVEFSFGATDSLYVYDPAGHCVEIGGFDRHGDASGDSDGAEDPPGDTDPDAAPPLSGLFEVVLEVTDLPAAEARYRRLGFEVVDRGEKRRRVRLSGPVDLELWEPQLGIAEARGGLHVDLAFATDDPEAAVEAGGPRVGNVESVPDGRRVVDDDGHVLTFLRAGSQS